MVYRKRRTYRAKRYTPKRSYKKTYKRKSYKSSTPSPLARQRAAWRMKAGLVKGTTGKPRSFGPNQINAMIKKIK